MVTVIEQSQLPMQLADQCKAIHYGYGMHEFDIIPTQNLATALRVMLTSFENCVRCDELIGPSTIGTIRHFTKSLWMSPRSLFYFYTCEYSHRNGSESVATWYLRSWPPTGSSPFSIRPFFNAPRFQRRTINQLRVIASMSVKPGKPMLVSISRATWWFSSCPCLLSTRCRCPASISLGWFSFSD